MEKDKKQYLNFRAEKWLIDQLNAEMEQTKVTNRSKAMHSMIDKLNKENDALRKKNSYAEIEITRAKAWRLYAEQLELKLGVKPETQSPIETPLLPVSQDKEKPVSEQTQPQPQQQTPPTPITPKEKPRCQRFANTEISKEACIRFQCETPKKCKGCTVLASSGAST